MFTLLIVLCFLWWQVQIQLLADLNLKKTPQLVELVDDSNVFFSFYLINVLIICKGYNLFLNFAIYAGNND
jgi:hypothetical protein